LYFHGNKNNITRYAPYAGDFTRHGYEVWMMDYPGFGKSTGVFNEQKLYEYALVLYKLARSRWKPSQIILYGKSLGTGIAAQLADVRDCRRLILESPYYSLESVARHYLPVYPWGHLLHYHFPTWSHLPAVTAPVTIFQGTADWQTPYRNASRLKPLLKPGDEFVTIEGGGHNNLHEFPLFKEKLDSVLMR
jgi:pimeloyl-ACP methyl ester carboxylesterase